MAASKVRTKKPTTEEPVALPEIVTLTHSEMLEVLDEASRFYLGISGDEFLRRWKTHDFEGFNEVDVVHVGMIAQDVAE